MAEADDAGVIANLPFEALDDYETEIFVRLRAEAFTRMLAAGKRTVDGQRQVLGKTYESLIQDRHRPSPNTIQDFDKKIGYDYSKTGQPPFARWQSVLDTIHARRHELSLRERSGVPRVPLSGTWWQTIGRQDKREYESTDRVELYYRSDDQQFVSLAGTATRHACSDRDQVGRTWGIQGRALREGEDMILIFWSVGERLQFASYGTIFHHRRDGESAYDGTYMRYMTADQGPQRRVSLTVTMVRQRPRGVPENLPKTSLRSARSSPQ